MIGRKSPNLEKIKGYTKQYGSANLDDLHSIDPRLKNYMENKQKFSSDYLDKYEIIKKVVPCAVKQ